MYNYFRQGWIVSRLAKTLQEAFEGQRPVVLTFPHQDSIAAEEVANGFTLFFAGPRATPIRRAFEEKITYLVQAGSAPNPSSPNGFAMAKAEPLIRLSPARVEIPSDMQVAQDAWPFLYLRAPMIPNISLRGAAMISAVSLLLLLLFGWRPTSTHTTLPHMALFFLGAGFMLLETKAIVHMALVFGSTWVVNTSCVLGHPGNDPDSKLVGAEAPAH
jgi:hypothetical protein